MAIQKGCAGSRLRVSRQANAQAAQACATHAVPTPSAPLLSMRPSAHVRDGSVLLYRAICTVWLCTSQYCSCMPSSVDMLRRATLAQACTASRAAGNCRRRRGGTILAPNAAIANPPIPAVPPPAGFSSIDSASTCTGERQICIDRGIGLWVEQARGRRDRWQQAPSQSCKQSPTCRQRPGRSPSTLHTAAIPAPVSILAEQRQLESD